MVPRRSAKSSTPSTATRPTGGSGSARISRSSVDRPTLIPTWRPAAIRPVRPGPTRPPPALLAGRHCAARGARSTPEPARRTCTRCSRRDRRRTAAPSTTPRPAAPTQEDPPGAADSGCAPASTPARIGGSATPAPVDAHRSPSRRRPGRPSRSPPATDAEAEPGNSTQQPQTQEHHAQPASVTESVDRTTYRDPLQGWGRWIYCPLPPSWS